MKSRNSLIVLTVAALALSLLALPAAAERGDDSKRASKNGKTTGSAGGAEVVVEYGRPNVKGRTIWGGLVPYGKVWRTGADEATTITFGSDVTVEGEPLAAGTYSLFTIPGEDEWTIVFNETAEQWGAYNHDAGKDVLRVTVEPRAGEEMVEAMDFVVEDDAVVLRWEKVEVPFTVGSAG